MEWILIFIIGLNIGSFLNVVIFRLDKKSGILTGRSECPRCLKQLKWYDLFPVVSYVFLAKKCRYCKTGISFVYPLVELLTAFSFVFIYLSYVNGSISLAMSIFNILIISAFISLIFFDYLYLLIPDRVILPLIILSLLFNYFFRQSEFITLLLSALTMSSIFAIMYLVSKGEWVGLGDAKLLFLIGLVLGYPLGFLSMIFSVWIAALVGIGLMISGRANRKTALPFGSFLAGISILIIIFQNEIQKIVQQFI